MGIRMSFADVTDDAIEKLTSALTLCTGSFFNFPINKDPPD